MPLYAAGQRIRGSEINALPQLYRTNGDQSKTDANFSNAVGLAFQGEVSAWYLIECFLFYKAQANRDIKLQWTFPAGTAGWWAADGITADQASSGGPPNVGGSVGAINRQSLLFHTPGVHGFNGGDGIDVFAKPAATIQIATIPGTVQLQYAQLTADGANPTTIRAGSCIRVSRIA